MTDLTDILTPEEAAFVIAVFRCPGCKIREGTFREGVANWKRPEELGLIKCVGSYRWEPTDKLTVGVIE